MIFEESVETTAFSDVPLDAFASRKVMVYLPPSYHASSRHYPTLFLLHGFGTEAPFWAFGPSLIDACVVKQPIDLLIDRLINSGQADETIVVMPDGWARFGSNLWVDSIANGRAATHVVKDVVEFVDSQYRTIPSPESRGIMGHGVGGLGAWNLASQYPEVFGAVGVLSGEMHFALTVRTALYRFFTKRFPAPLDGPQRDDMDSWYCYAFAAALSPDPDSPPYHTRFPLRYPSGEEIEEIWEEWLSFDPTVNWRSRADQLRQLRTIFLDVGSRDERRLHYGHRILSAGLTSAKIRHEAREFAGGHISHMFERLALAYTRLSEVLIGEPERLL
jgi:S-formylglutathione hydrolase FrmB